MAKINPAKLIRKVLETLGDAAMRKAGPQIPYKTLRKALNLFLLPDNQTARVQIPHYWALYVHDGRPPFNMPAGRYMVWFNNPADDPRLRGRPTPVRASDLRRLTRDQFIEGMFHNRIRQQAGDEPFMVVTNRIRKGTPAIPFFSNSGGMAGFVNEANAVAGALVQRELTDSISDLSSVTRGGKAKVQAAEMRIK